MKEKKNLEIKNYLFAFSNLFKFDVLQRYIQRSGLCLSYLNLKKADKEIINETIQTLKKETAVLDFNKYPVTVQDILEFGERIIRIPKYRIDIEFDINDILKIPLCSNETDEKIISEVEKAYYLAGNTAKRKVKSVIRTSDLNMKDSDGLTFEQILKIAKLNHPPFLSLDGETVYFLRDKLFPLSINRMFMDRDKKKKKCLS